MKGLLFALVIAIVSLSSCDWVPGDGTTDPTDDNGYDSLGLTHGFWTSSTEMGELQTEFKPGESVYLNYEITNNTGHAMAWTQVAGGPFLTYSVKGMGQISDFYIAHPQVRPGVALEGVMQAGETYRYSWKVNEGTQLPSGAFLATGEILRKFNRQFMPSLSIEFTVTE